MDALKAMMGMNVKPVEKANVLLANSENEVQSGGKAKAKKVKALTKAHKVHNGKSYVVRKGAKGGRYILVKGNKVYL